MHIGTFVFCTDSTVSPLRGLDCRKYEYHKYDNYIYNNRICNYHIYNKKILCISNFVCIFATP